jgi:T1SS-143 domain-containing protein
MRYEDTSGSVGNSGTPEARDDADALATGSNGPATGNVISGAGTLTGKAGADTAANGHVVAIRGAGGTDTSDNGQSLHVDGRYGALVIDEHGNYKYVADGRAPADFRDLFQYTLADSKGGRSVADLVITRGAELKVADNAQRIVPGPDGVVTLPAGVDLNDVHVVGRNLVVTLPDGSQIVIVDGAVFVPQLVLGGVEVPSTNLAALLIDAEPKPAAGNTQSSGGNFDVPVPPLDPGVPLGDLIPPTELVFTPPEIKEIGQFVDKHPDAGTVTVQLDDDDVPGKNGNPGGVGDVAGAPNATTSGNLPGSGGDGALTWDLSDGGAPAGFTYVDGPNGSILVQQVQDGNTVTVLTITINAATGAYTVTENAPILHPAGGDENNVGFVINYTVTDSDGDTAPGTLNINVNDDTPTVSVIAGSDANVILTTHDAATIGANSEAVSTTANFGGVFSGTVVSPGADGAGAGSSSGYALSTTGGASGLSSHGLAINLYNVGGVIVGSTSATSGGIDASNTVFTVSVDATGEVTLTQFSQIDHTADPSPTGAPFTDDIMSLADGSITLTRSETVVDKDGDSVTGSASVGIGANLHFVDDGPTIGLADHGEPQLVVDETDLTANATASFAANFSANFGADGPAASGSITYALGISAPGADSGLVDVATGQDIVLVLNGGVVEGHVGTASGALAFTVSVDAAGDVTLDQIRAVVHPDGTNPDTNETVTLSADGLVTLTATAHDFDGDTASQSLNIGTNLIFHDDGPTISASQTQPSLTVDETDLSTNASASFAGVFTSSFGADGAGTITYALGISAPGADSGLVDTLSGQAIVLVQNGSVIEGHVGNAAGALAFTVTVDASGNVTLDQIRAVIHPTPSNPDTSEGVTLSADNLVTLTATVTDKDGDQSSATANIGQNLVFLDDGPHANNDTDTVPPAGTTATGNVITGVGTNEGAGNADNAGADQPGHITAIQGTDGTDTTFSGGVLSIHGTYGTLAIDADGNYTYTRDAGAPGSVQDVFTYTLADADGDSVTATLTININDSAPTGGSVSVGLDDDALAGGNPGGTGDDPDSVNATGTLPGSGGDGALTFGVLLTGAPSGFTYVSGGAGIVLVQQGGTTVLTITVNSATGDYSVVQNHAIDHAAGGNENNQAFTVNYTVTDADGDSAPGTINISVDDDTPTVSANAAVQLDDDALAGGNAGGVGDDPNATNTTGTLAHSYGADGAGSVAYLTTGAPAGFSYALQGNGDLWVMQGATHVLTLTVNSTTGAYSVTQVAAIDHPAGGDENNVSFTISYNVTDHDGDTATGSIVVNVDDDTPTVSANAAVQLDDDALAGGNPGGVGDDPNATNTTGTLAHSYGADGAGSVAYLNSGAPAGFSYALQGNGDLWVMQGATHVLTLTVNASTGAYTVTQVAPIDHPAGGDENNVSFTISYNVTDHDGDSATGTIVVNVDDDTPTAAIVTTGQHVSIDESVGNQVDSNDVTGPIAAFAGVTNVGDDLDVAGTGPIQFATNAAAIVASTGSSYGADGPGTTAFSLNVSAAGVDSGLNTTDGHDILLYVENGIVVGRVSGGADDGKAAFAVSIDATGHVSMVEYLSIQQPDATNPDDSVSIANGAILAVVTVTDHDGDPATNSIAIGSQIQFQDSGPVMTAASNINIQNSGDVAATGTFAFNLGADGANATNDVISIGASSATVNGVAVTNYVLTPGVENATTASYSFSFDYPNGTGTTAHETGTLVFDKASGTYTVDLSDPISGFSILATAGAPASAFVNYDLGTSNTSNSPTQVAVVQLDTNFFLQFSGVYDKTGSDHQTTTNGGGYAPVTSATFGNLDLFSQANATVTVSSSAAGVAGNTIQGGEVLDFNLYATDQHGTLGATPTQSATSMFIELDGVGGSEDMIIILKLYDTVTHQYTEQALMVQNGDIITSNATLAGTAYAGIVLDSNDGLIVIEANDYQNGNANLVIVGAQIAGSDDGVTGTAASFNGALGAGGGWDGSSMQAFSTDVSDAPFKIQNIGFALTTTTDQTAHLSFDVTVKDGDGDTVTQTITADVTAAADSSTAISLSAAVTAVVPVVLDLNGDGVHFLASDAGVHYDYGHGSVATAWASPQDGILVNDANHNGTVDGASEFVFGSGSVTDLQALAAFDTNHDGQLSSADANFANFAVWQDANSNGVVDAGELQSLTARGIASISLSTDGISYTAAGGDVTVAGTGSYTNADGSTGSLADAAFLTGARAASDDLKSSSALSTNTALIGALAAAGLVASDALGAASGHAGFNLGAGHGLDTAGLHTQAFAPVALDAVSGDHASNDLLPNAGAAASAAAKVAESHASDAGQAHSLSVADNDAQSKQGPTELLAGTQAPAHDQASANAAVAQIAAFAAPGAQHQVLGQVLADALHGGANGATIDHVLSALPGNGGGADAALAALASHAGAAVSNGDSHVFAGFTATQAAFTMEHMMIHIDAAPTHA